ncbi:hypothetical protein [Polyangium jinanense]|uniref:Lipoprotein n=1 Tax=Polyangium jinanense TaxID=2829994 RepID=A0A9X4AXW6_9BACT|nr:hypothetical protein [Polyangium jinanense]MDC3960507.1 hypothetical protein [Polyangium jinanense]MDC3986720.1 hypothetical protein [Polyangium jinanense]
MNARLACWALVGLLMGCTSTGGQTGEIGADPCDFLPAMAGETRVEHGLTDPTPLGVSGQEAIDATGGSGSFEVAWANGTKSAVTWSLAADTESSPVVQHIDRKSECADEFLQVLVLGQVSSADGILEHEQRGALYRSNDGAADLRLAFSFEENPFPDVYAGGMSGDSCSGCGFPYELVFESRWEAGASNPRGHVYLIETGTLLGEVGTF